jgi:DNA-binding response OmpR family regulator
LVISYRAQAPKYMPNDTKKILIVEDEEAMRHALSEKFKNSGFLVVTAPDGEAGLEIFKKEKPDLVMLDILMPKMDGISLTKKIRENSAWGQEVPIVMLTNLADPDSVSEVAGLGVFDFLVKTDWKLDDVVNLVKKKLGVA